MESQKIINLLDHKDEDNPRFEKRKWCGILLMITIMEIIARVMMFNLLLSLTQKL